MRTLRRRRDLARQSQLTVVVAIDADDAVEPGDIVMLEGLGACFVLSVSVPDAQPPEHGPDERAIALEVEAFATDNDAPDLG